MNFFPDHDCVGYKIQKYINSHWRSVVWYKVYKRLHIQANDAIISDDA